MWDAYKDAGEGKERYSFLPFVLSAYFVTVGLMYAARVKIIWNIIRNSVVSHVMCNSWGYYRYTVKKSVLRKRINRCLSFF
ncbi:hypothetical protein GCM10020331_009950 [Ectobacillus funiculus]